MFDMLRVRPGYRHPALRGICVFGLGLAPVIQATTTLPLVSSFLRLAQMRPCLSTTIRSTNPSPAHVVTVEDQGFALFL
jgi:hypothetical protein